jgi:hypothetical protein
VKNREIGTNQMAGDSGDDEPEVLHEQSSDSEVSKVARDVTR